MLFWHKHNIEKALADLPNFTPFPDEWTVEDKVLFEQAFSFHGKSFHRIRQMVITVNGRAETATHICSQCFSRLCHCGRYTTLFPIAKSVIFSLLIFKNCYFTINFLQNQIFPEKDFPQVRHLKFCVFASLFQWKVKVEFSLLQLPDKSIASLVKYYYSWKKTRSRTSLMDRQAKKLTKAGDR